MEKSIEDYIKEIQDFSSKSIFQESVPEVTSTNERYARGILRLSVTHSKGTFPVSGAKFTVKDKNGNILSQGIIDSSGKSPDIELPALPTSITQQPGTDFANSAVFYNAEIIADNYISMIVNNIPIFENITTLQNFDLTFFGASANSNTEIITLPTNNSL